MMGTPVGRRRVLKGAAAAVAAGTVPRIVCAAGDPIALGAVVPLTGSGGVYGPPMLKSMQWIVERVNAAGGLLGRPVKLVGEDDETNPDSGVKAARKLIDVDKVPAVMGTWASAVTTAVAPLCWESKTFLTTVSGSDTITLLPHQGYLVRTQPNTNLQMQKMGEFMLELGAKRVFILGAQTPFAETVKMKLADVLTAKGSVMAGALIYDASKTSFRSEVDAALKAQPDMIFLNGYQNDAIVLLKDLYRAGYAGAKVSLAYAINQKVLDAVPQEVAEGTYTLAPSPAVGSVAYKRLSDGLGIADLDPYTSQVADHASLMCLAMARGKEATGRAIHDAIRKVTEPGGVVVDDVVEGLKLLAAGKEIKYTGVSGPCVFTDIGDILDCKFRYEQAVAGRFKLLRVA